MQQFEDELVQSGMNGGMRASHLLQSAMEKTVKPMLSEPAPHLRCHVRVYANVSGLSQTYVRQGIIPNVSVFHDFVRGFNNGHNMCDYVDAGNGKECADEKVKGTASLMLPSCSFSQN